MREVKNSQPKCCQVSGDSIVPLLISVPFAIPRLFPFELGRTSVTAVPRNAVQASAAAPLNSDQERAASEEWKAL